MFSLRHKDPVKFRVTQGRHFQYQSKACMRHPIGDYMQLTFILSRTVSKMSWSICQIFAVDRGVNLTKILLTFICLISLLRILSVHESDQ